MYLTYIQNNNHLVREFENKMAAVGEWGAV